MLSLATRTVGAVTFVELGFKTYTDTNTIGGKTGVSNTHTHTHTHIHAYTDTHTIGLKLLLYKALRY